MSFLLLNVSSYCFIFCDTLPKYKSVKPDEPLQNFKQHDANCCNHLLMFPATRIDASEFYVPLVNILEI